jgi:capsular polysaccharide biosynthesis protein
MMEQEIDLRPYLWALLRSWKLILGAVLVAVVAAVALALLRPSQYQSNAQLLIAPTTSQVTLDPRFETRDSTLVTNPTFQRQALADLAESPILEARVAEELGLADYEPGELLAQVRVSSTSDLISITVTDPDASQAAKLADTWARSYERLVNELYTGVEAQSEQVATEFAAAQGRYEAAQRELETFLNEGGVVAADQQVQRLEGLLDGSREAQQMLYTQYLTRTQELNLILEDARIVREQAGTGAGASLADSLAALSLRSRVAGGAELPVELRFDSGESFAQGREVTRADLEQLIEVVQSERDRLVGETERLGAAIAAGDGSALGLAPELRAAYERDLATARGTLEQLRARERLLTQQRDIALTSLEVLQRRSDDLRLAQANPEVSVRYVGSGLVPPASLARSLLLGTVIAAMLALILSAGLVLALEIGRRLRAAATESATPLPPQPELAADQRAASR